MCQPRRVEASPIPGFGRLAHLSVDSRVEEHSRTERHIRIGLAKRGVSCVALLIDDKTPHTCAAVWEALPLGQDVFDGKYARNEIYTLLPAFAAAEPDTGELPHRPDTGRRRVLRVWQPAAEHRLARLRTGWSPADG